MNDSEKNLKRSENPLSEEDRLLCMHCRRTSSNGVRCLGICVKDSEY